MTTYKYNNLPLNLSDKAKAYKDNNTELFHQFLTRLTKEPLPHLFDYISFPEKFQFPDNSDEFKEIFIEVLPEYIKVSQGWSEETFNAELSDYQEQSDIQLNRPRLKACRSCGKDLTEEFALNLTTDDLLNKEKVMVVCPKCGKTNYFDANF